MPAPQRHPSVYQQLSRLAQEAKRDGMDFERFWERSVYGGWEGDKTSPRRVWKRGQAAPAGVILWPSFDKERLPLLESLEATKKGWRRAYEDIPPAPREAALTRLAPGGAASVPDSLPDGMEVGGAVA